MTKSTEEQIAAIERRMEQLRARKQRIVARENARARRRRTHLLIQLGGILASDSVLGFAVWVGGAVGNRRGLRAALGAHAGELGVRQRDAGVTLPGLEPDALAGESGTSSYGI